MPSAKSFQNALTPYLDRIPADEDKVLFEEAAKAYDAKAYRGAYILIWLCCVEALKRRFREASHYDNEAGKVLGSIKELERQRKSVDKTLITKAQEYGFISSTQATKLETIYQRRSLYAHPYS